MDNMHQRSSVRTTHQVDVSIIGDSVIWAKVSARVSLLRFPLSELHNQPLLLLLLDLLGNDWVPDSDLGFHLPTHRFPPVVQVKAVMDHALGLEGSKFDLSSSDQSVRPEEAALAPYFKLHTAPLHHPLEGLVPGVDHQFEGGVILGVVVILHHSRLV